MDFDKIEAHKCFSVMKLFNRMYFCMGEKFQVHKVKVNCDLIGFKHLTFFKGEKCFFSSHPLFVKKGFMRTKSNSMLIECDCVLFVCIVLSLGLISGYYKTFCFV